MPARMGKGALFMKPMPIFLVWKTGVFTTPRGTTVQYHLSDVCRIIGQIRHYMPQSEIVVLTDQSHGVPAATVKLIYDLPGWWSKLEVFRPSVYAAWGGGFYMDLDTVAVGDFSHMLNCRNELAMLTDFNGERPASGIMAWGQDQSYLTARFMQDPAKHIAAHVTGSSWGDQGFISAHAPDPVRIQDMFPGEVVSYKRHGLAHQPLPPKAKLVCFHGRPKPADVSHDWIIIPKT